MEKTRNENRTGAMQGEESERRVFVCFQRKVFVR
jgi:hypothetical protein